MKTLNAFLNGQTKKGTISGFENCALSSEAMNKVRGGDGGPTTDIWIPDEERR